MYKLIAAKCKAVASLSSTAFTSILWILLNKNIAAIISLDAGTEESYNYTRRGGDWNKLMKNLEFISTLYKENKLKFVRLDCVVQNKNYKEIGTFINIAKKYNFHCYLSEL